MGGRGQSSKTVTRRKGESTMSFIRRKRMAEAGTSRSYTGVQFQNADGNVGIQKITKGIDSNGKPFETSTYTIDGVEVTRSAFRTYNTNELYHQTETLTSNRRQTTKQRDFLRRIGG